MGYQNLIVIAFSLFLIACPEISEGQINELASKLTKYSKIVDGVIRYGDNTLEDISESRIMAYVREKDPQIHESFKEYKIKISIKGKNSVVLVCTSDERYGLLEDAGCTAKMDKYLSDENGRAASCVFTLDAEQVCAQ